MATARFELKLLLPDVPDARDACVERLRQLIAGHDGITLAHAKRDDDIVCVHFDPQRVSLRAVTRLVKATAPSTRSRRARNSPERFAFEIVTLADRPFGTSPVPGLILFTVLGVGPVSAAALA